MELTLIDESKGLAPYRHRIAESEKDVQPAVKADLLTMDRPSQKFDFIRLCDAGDIQRRVQRVVASNTNPVFKFEFVRGSFVVDASFRSKKEAENALAFYVAVDTVMTGYHSGKDYLGVLTAGGLEPKQYFEERAIGPDHERKFFCNIKYDKYDRFSTMLHGTKRLALNEAGYQLLSLVLLKWKEECDLASSGKEEVVEKKPSRPWVDSEGKFRRPSYKRANFHYLEDQLYKQRGDKRDNVDRDVALARYKEAARDIGFSSSLACLNSKGLLDDLNLVISKPIDAESLYFVLDAAKDDDYFVINLVQALSEN